jgi:hypothetical protein
MEPTPRELNKILFIGYALLIVGIVFNIILNLNPGRAIHALDAVGYQNIEIHGFRFFGCGQ